MISISPMALYNNWFKNQEKKIIQYTNYDKNQTKSKKILLHSTGSANKTYSGNDKFSPFLIWSNHPVAL